MAGSQPFSRNLPALLSHKQALGPHLNPNICKHEHLFTLVYNYHSTSLCSPLKLQRHISVRARGLTQHPRLLACIYLMPWAASIQIYYPFYCTWLIHNSLTHFFHQTKCNSCGDGAKFCLAEQQYIFCVHLSITYISDRHYCREKFNGESPET